MGTRLVESFVAVAEELHLVGRETPQHIATAIEQLTATHPKPAHLVPIRVAA